MPKIHEPEYHELAEYFDLLNQKYAPYEEEVRFIKDAFEKYQKKVYRILDLACGTGIHAIDLARKGYEVVGVDLSTEMLGIARRKAATAGVEAEFIEGDMMDLHFDAEFDAVIGVNYPVATCTAHSDISKLIVGVRNALKQGGVFIADFLSQYGAGESRSLEWVEAEDVKIECIQEWAYDKVSQVSANKMTYFVTKDGVISRFEGYSEWRMFYPQEMLFYLRSMGNFKILGLHKRWSLEDELAGPDFAVVAERA